MCLSVCAERENVCVCVWERENVCVCVCVCVLERERESVCVFTCIGRMRETTWVEKWGKLSSKWFFPFVNYANFFWPELLKGSKHPSPLFWNSSSSMTCQNWKYLNFKAFFLQILWVLFCHSYLLDKRSQIEYFYNYFCTINYKDVFSSCIGC